MTAKRDRVMQKRWRRKNAAHKSAVDKAWRKANREKLRRQRRRAHLISKFGITPEQYDDLLKAQGGCCAICRGTQTGAPKNGSFAVDHHHATGAVRGLLCRNCNTAVGLLKESPAVVRRLLGYITAMPLFTGIEGMEAAQ